MKATIVGGGIGGLTTAIALQQQGIDFEIFEAAPEIKPAGAGIVMASNAMQVFQRLGIDKKIISVGVEIVKAFGVDQSFKLISGLAVKERVASLYGIGSFALHRGRLQQVLLAELDPKKIFLNKDITTLTQNSEGVSISFDDGTSREADFVIGADGIKSATRRNIFGELPLRYSGQTCWRGMTKCTLPPDKKFNSYEMWGKQKGLRFGFVPTGADEVYYFTTFLSSPYERDEPSNLKNDLLQKYSCFGTTAVQLIESTPVENIIRSDIFDLQPIKKWYLGRVALLGDAAHATTPNLGQGGCQAVEDAFVIAKCLKDHSSIEKAFERYQAIRYEKAVHVVNMSWSFGRLTNIRSPFLQAVRNGLIRTMPESMAVRQLDKILKLNY